MSESTPHFFGMMRQAVTPAEDISD